MEALAIYELAEKDRADFAAESPACQAPSRGDRLLTRLKQRDRFTIDGIAIRFSDDMWDFTAIIKAPISSGAKISFGKCGRFADVAKLYCFTLLVKTDYEIGSIDANVRDISPLLELAHETGCPSIPAIPYSLFESLYGKPRETNYTTLTHKRATVLSFLRFYELHFSLIPDRRCFKLLEDRDRNRLKAEKLAGKTPEIPQAYLEDLLELCLKIAKDASALADDRAVACCLLLYSQIGCRTGEVGTFTFDGIGKEDGGERGEDLWFASFKYAKRKGAPRGEWTPTTCYMNGISMEAFRMLVDICSAAREKAGTNALVVFSCGSTATAETFYDRYKRFCVRNLSKPPFVNCTSKYPKLSSAPAAVAVRSWAGATETSAPRMLEKLGLKDDDVLAYPTIRMFRNTVCTNLYRQKKSLGWIRVHLNHLYEEMTAYYNRADAEIDREFSNATYQAIVLKQEKLLGRNADRHMDLVNRFLEKDGIARNLGAGAEDVIERISAKYPIKKKFGGMCIRCAGIAPCSADDLTDEIMCAYGVCANQCSFYWMAPVTYGELRESSKIVEGNLSRGHVKGAQHELKKLQRILEEKLEPELAELRNQLRTRGASPILTDHPELEGMIRQMDAIEEEASKWKSWTI